MNKKAIIFSIIAISAVIIIVKVANTVTSYFSFNSTILSKSMSPTLIPSDKVFIQKIPNSINTGDIIAYSHSKLKSPSAIQIHRVIATGGETISFKKITPNSFVVLINGKELDEPYLEKNCKYFNVDMSVYATQTVPKNHYYVLGDNRANSYDSRFIGTVPISDIKGKVTKIIKPKNRKRIL